MNKGTLYSNNHPNTTIHGLGFKDAATAKKSIKNFKNKKLILEKFPKSE